MKSFILTSMAVLGFFSSSHLFGKKIENSYYHENSIPPRKQWNGNFGYCGETSMISAGLYYGQYISQYTLRAIASQNTPQNKKGSQLLLGINDYYAATQLHLKAEEWDTIGEQDTTQFLSWMKEQTLCGYPVIIGVYTNEYLFYGKTNPDAGDSDYDHIVPVYAISSNHSLNDFSYYPDDILYFSDNGLWGSAQNPPYKFNYLFSSFQANRQQANAKKGAVYSLSNNGSNYGIVIKGVSDTDGDTLPIRITTNVNDEVPAIQDKSNIPPTPMPLTLTVTVSNLAPNVPYRVYRYDDLNAVPDSQFNAHASHATKTWDVQISEGSTYVFVENIQSDQMAIYRAVLASAP